MAGKDAVLYVSTREHEPANGMQLLRNGALHEQALHGLHTGICFLEGSRVRARFLACGRFFPLKACSAGKA